MACEPTHPRARVPARPCAHVLVFVCQLRQQGCYVCHVTVRTHAYAKSQHVTNGQMGHPIRHDRPAKHIQLLHSTHTVAGQPLGQFMDIDHPCDLATPVHLENLFKGPFSSLSLHSFILSKTLKKIYGKNYVGGQELRFLLTVHESLSDLFILFSQDFKNH